jgi:hypothetical protein
VRNEEAAAAWVCVRVGLVHSSFSMSHRTAIDVMRIISRGQIVAAMALVVVGLFLARRAASRA